MVGMVFFPSQNGEPEVDSETDSDDDSDLSDMTGDSIYLILCPPIHTSNNNLVL